MEISEFSKTQSYCLLTHNAHIHAYDYVLYIFVIYTRELTERGDGNTLGLVAQTPGPYQSDHDFYGFLIVREAIVILEFCSYFSRTFPSLVLSQGCATRGPAAALRSVLCGGPGRLFHKIQCVMIMNIKV